MGHHHHQHHEDHGHHHHHHGPVELQQVGTAFVVGILLNFLFVVIEVLVGLSIHSLSLLSDAGHNLADVGALALSLLAFRLLKVKANEQYTYGYRKTSILTALFNAVVLLVSIGAIGYEAIHRFFNPEPLPGITIALVAGIGILINAGTALLFLRQKDKDLNIRSAYLHLLSDALVSLGLVLAGILIRYTGWYWLDPAFSVLIALVILLSTWNLLRHSLRLSLDGVPPGIDLQEIRNIALQVPGVRDLHHMHIWAISTTENALTAHLVVDDNSTMQQMQAVRERLRHALQHQNIQHITLQSETTQAGCSGEDC
ncbi:MAG TPA: cation diffusion facilitator family transporter [Chitinophagaceae bacterium]|nr:cation diffusion facilitator family transporter [Chitinophagaceae bacterium]